MDRRTLIASSAALLAASSARAWPVHGLALPPPPFDAGGVVFDGATWLDTDSLTATDNSFVSYAYWVQISYAQLAGKGFPVPWASKIGGGGGEITYESIFSGDFGSIPGQVAVEFGVHDTNQFLYADSNTSVIADATWTLVAVGVKTNFAAGLKTIVITLNGVNVTSNIIDGDAAFINELNANNFYIGNDGEVPVNPFFGSMAEFWFAPGQYLDFTNPANIAKFRDPMTGHPVSLGADGSTPTGTAPAIYLHRSTSGPASDFATNLGTGGAFTTTGALTASGTNP